MDLIYRQAAIDALWKERQQADALIDKYLRNGYMKLREDAKAERKRIEKDIAIINALPSAEPEDKCGECDAWNQYKNYPRQRWIPCKDRLPERDGNYLVTDDSGGTKCVTVSQFIKCEDGSVYWDYVNVIAWCDLPEPYRGEQG